MVTRLLKQSTQADFLATELCQDLSGLNPSVALVVSLGGSIVVLVQR